MIRRFCNLEGWHETTINLTRRWLRILATLTLALLLVGANPYSLAQAAPASETIQFVMVAMPSAKYVCVNESMTFRVYVYRIGSQSDAGPNLKERLSGVAVDATVADTSIGKITPDRTVTGFSLYDPVVAEFEFKAGKNPGTTTIFFEGLINKFWAGTGKIEKTEQPIYVDEPAQVEVRKCGYKAELILQENFGGIMSWTGTGDEIRLNADSDTHFSGTTDFQIAEQILIQIPYCTHTGTVAPTKVDYSADLVGDMLNLTVTIQNTTHTVTAGTGCRPFSATAETGIRSASVSLPSLGGVTSYSALYAVYTIIVERVIDEATARQWGPGQTAGISWSIGDSLTLQP